MKTCRSRLQAAIGFFALVMISHGVAAPEPEVEEPGDRAGQPAAPESGVFWGAVRILGRTVDPGTRLTLHWTAGQSFAGSEIETPVLVTRGAEPGLTLCLTAAIHGDELNGVEIVRRVMADIEPAELKGMLIGVPIVNLLGFSRGSRYLPDRRDLNRYFPGQPLGSTASRIAFVFFNDVIRQCDRLVDFHTGSFKRTNLPQLRANLKDAGVKEFVGHFGATPVLHKVGYSGTLRTAATNYGIPAVAFELGEPATLQLDDVSSGIKAVDTLLDKLGMVDRFRMWAEQQPVFYRSRWLRAVDGGILTSSVPVGADVRVGDVLGQVTNPITNEHSVIESPVAGRVLGRALNQFVLPGFAAFHIGIETDADASGQLDDAKQTIAPGSQPALAAPRHLQPDEPEPGDMAEDELH